MLLDRCGSKDPKPAAETRKAPAGGAFSLDQQLCFAKAVLQRRFFFDGSWREPNRASSNSTSSFEPI